MASKMLLKRGSGTPLDTSLTVGEIAIDSTNGFLFTKTTSGVVKKFGTASGGIPASILLVGGGGGGGGYGGGGGGAGGVYYVAAYTLTAGTVYNIIVGAGATAITTYTVRGNNGGNSRFNPTGSNGFTVSGGGGAGSSNTPTTAYGSGGGSGGGQSFSYNQGVPAGLGIPFQGNNGGNGGTGGTGGGGGASAAGTTGTSQSLGGNGGAGISNSITGTAVVYGGGGGGGAFSGTAGTAGAGGGGAGSVTGAGTNGLPNTGGGGGGAGNYTSGSSAGGSGVVILSVPTTNFSTAILSGTAGTTYTTSINGSNTVIKWIAVGTHTYTA